MGEGEGWGGVGEGGGKVRPAVTRVGPSAARDGKKLDNPVLAHLNTFRSAYNTRFTFKVGLPI